MSSLRIDLLTEDENVAQICREYWACAEDNKFTISVAQIAKTHSLKSSEVSQLVYENCDAYSEDISCPDCGGLTVFSNRSEYQQAVRWPNKNQLCSKCQAEKTALQKAQREATSQKRLDAIRSIFALNQREIPETALFEFEDIVYLVSFVRVAASDNLIIYGPLTSSLKLLCPNEDYGREVVKHLFSKGLISIHPDSPIDAFDYEDDIPTRYTVSSVVYALSTGDDLEKTRLHISNMENALKSRNTWPIKWEEQALSLWRKIALQECLQYLELVLVERGFTYKVNEKLLLVLETLLEKYSVAQAYRFIWRAARDAADFHLRALTTNRNAPKQHAANTVAGSIQRQSERAQAEGWEIDPFGRNFNCPESMVSQVLFNTALQIGSAGFNETPRIFFKREDAPIDDTPSNTV